MHKWEKVEGKKRRMMKGSVEYPEKILTPDLSIHNAEVKCTRDTTIAVLRLAEACFTHW